jgi:hypothetical protein
VVTPGGTTATTSWNGSEIERPQVATEDGLIEAPSMTRSGLPVPLSMVYPTAIVVPRRAAVWLIQ